MNTTTQLFIRACKSKNPNQRVHSVYNRFYGKLTVPSDSDAYIAELLLKICEDYKLLSLSKIVSELDPNSFWKRLYPENQETYNQNVIKVCTSAIMFTEIKNIEGFISPRKFR